MNKNLKTLILSGAISTLSLFQANGQAVKKTASKSMASKQPAALVLTGNNTYGDRDEYIQKWKPFDDLLIERLHQDRFNVSRVGKGYTPLNFENNSVINKKLSVMRSNKSSDFIYIGNHGVASPGDGVHKLTLDIKLEQLDDSTSLIRTKRAKTADIIKAYADKASEPNQTLSIILESCGGDQLLADLVDTKLPPGLFIETFSQPEDIAFAGTYILASRYIPNDNALGNIFKMHHAYNRNVYTDIEHTEKYSHGPSGSTLLMVKDDGEIAVWCPRKSIKDRMGKGFTPEEMDRILANCTKYANPQDSEDEGYINFMHMNAPYINSMMIRAPFFDNMGQSDQASLFQNATYLEEAITLPEYAAFLKKEQKQQQTVDFFKLNPQILIPR